MKKYSLFTVLGLVLLIGGIYAFTITPSTDVRPVEETPDIVVETAKTNFKWYTLEEALEANETTPKKFFIDVYTDWCSWCKVMDKKTFSQPKVQSYLAEHFYPVKLNAEQREAINFNGKTYEYIQNGRRGINQIAMELLKGRPSYPTIVYLDEDLNNVHFTKGFKPAVQLQPELEFVAENHYKKTTWQAYSAR